MKNVEFVDEEFQTAAEKAKILKNFQEILADRSLERMTRLSYEHFHLHCGDIAHFDIHGYRAYYAGSRFMDFLERFMNDFWIDRSDLNQVLCKLVQAEYASIAAEFERQAYNRKVAQLRELAEELGYRVVPKDETDEAVMDHEALMCTVEPDGQLRMLI